MELIDRRIAGLRTALDAFAAKCGKDAVAAVSGVLAMREMARGLAQALDDFRKADERGLCRRMHSRMRAKSEMLVRQAKAAMDSMGENTRLHARYDGEISYIRKQADMVKQALPSMRDDLPEEGQALLPIEEQSAEDHAASASSLFERRLSEIRTGIEHFRQSYPEDERRLSVVAYVSDMDMYAKLLQQLWERKRDRLAQGRKDTVSCMRVMFVNMEEYLGMSVMIAEHNGVSERYAGNHEYMRRALKSLIEAFNAAVGE